MIKEKSKKKIGKKKVKNINKNQKILAWVLGISFGIILLLVVFYFYNQSQIYFNYKGVEFQAVNEGSAQFPLIFYQTITLFVSNDGEEEPFGFRIRTKPSVLEKINFENIDNLELMRLNAYNLEGSFHCEGDGVIAMPNLKRVFDKTGMRLIYDPNSTCDSEGRYNHFTFKYGDKTEVKEISPKCYEVIVKGNDEKCEILPATEKLMVEIFVKYGEWQKS